MLFLRRKTLVSDRPVLPKNFWRATRLAETLGIAGSTLTEQEPIAIKRINDNITQIDFGKVAFVNIVMPVPIRLGQQRGNWIVPAPVIDRNIEQAGLIYANPPAVLTPPSCRSIMPFRWIEIEGVDADYPFELIRRRAAYSKT